MTPGPTAQDEAVCHSDDSTAHGIERNHTAQHERQDNAGCATLPVTLGAYEDDFRDPRRVLRPPAPSADVDLALHPVVNGADVSVGAGLRERELVALDQRRAERVYEDA